jgi:hypothetical protein
MASVDTRRDLLLGQIAIGQNEVLSSNSRPSVSDTQCRTSHRDRKLALVVQSWPSSGRPLPALLEGPSTISWGAIRDLDVQRDCRTAAEANLPADRSFEGQLQIESRFSKTSYICRRDIIFNKGIAHFCKTLKKRLIPICERQMNA